MQPIPDLQRILAPVPWVLVGGLALRAYIPERMTLDIGILIHERDAEATRVALLNAGYHVTGQLSIGGFSVQGADSTAPPIDVLIRTDPWLDAALSKPVADPAGYPVLGRPYLILLVITQGGGLEGRSPFKKQLFSLRLGGEAAQTERKRRFCGGLRPPHPQLGIPSE